jgi:hypothetical protein
MSDEHESHIIEQLEQVVKLTPLIRYLIAGAVAIASSVVTVAGWVWHTNAKVAAHEIRINGVEPRISSMEHWRATNDAAPKVSYQEVFALDKRMQRVEDQGAVVLETLKRIETQLKQ